MKPNSESDSEDSCYEVLKPFEVKEKTQSLSNFKRSHLYNENMRASLIGLKDGVPGKYSGYVTTKNKKDEKLKTKSLATEEDDSLSPVPPPRNRKNSSTARAAVKQICPVKTNSSECSSEAAVDVEDEQNTKYVEKGIRYFNTETGFPNDLENPVILPISALDFERSSSSNESSDSDESSSFKDDKKIYEVVGELCKNKTFDDNLSDSIETDYDSINDIGTCSDFSKPPLPPRRSVIFDSLAESDLDKETYIPFNMNEEPASLPPLVENADEIQKKRYAIIKCILENERIYMKNLSRLIVEYEEPLKEGRIISLDRVKIIFKHVHEIYQCHQLFNMALNDRAKDWLNTDAIGDVIYASFSKSLVLKAYSSFVCHFSNAMDSIKETCKLVPSFLNFLKYRHYLHNQQSLYKLMRQPLMVIPQLVVLVQALMKVTPFPHPDRLTLQMSLTHLECLSETLAEKRRDTLLKHKVKQLDMYCNGLSKSFASSKRYFVRQDDMILCVVKGGNIIKTKNLRLFMLSDMLVCTSLLLKHQQIKRMSNKRYEVKWCVPIIDVDVVQVGKGVSVNMIRHKSFIQQSNSSTYPCHKRINDLQHDINVIGQICGLVASLRRSYKFTNVDKVNNWFKDVRNVLNGEMALANMHWIELSIPDIQGNGRVSLLFNVDSPMKKMEWLAELDNVKLHLSLDNNPGWYMQEESVSAGETAVLRRTLPLITKKIPLFAIDPKYTVETILEIPYTHTANPVLWVFSGTEHIGVVTILEMTSNPSTYESFVACDARICCAEIVEETDCFTIWIGTITGKVLVYATDSLQKKQLLFKTVLKDSVVSMRFSQDKVFVGLANGMLACFRRKKNGSWDIANPTIISLGVQSVMCLSEVDGSLWCASGIHILILDTYTLGIKQKIDTSEYIKRPVRNLALCGMGVWVSNWKSANLNLYHIETHELLQTISVTTPLSRMKNDIDLIPGSNLDKVYVTSLLAKEGLLWVGLNIGLIITYPLPRLGGIPTVSGQACISFHAHKGPVKYFHAFKVQANRKQQDAMNAARDNVLADSMVSSEDTLGENLNSGASSRRPMLSTEEPYYFTVEAEDVSDVTANEYDIKGMQNYDKNDESGVNIHEHSNKLCENFNDNLCFSSEDHTNFNNNFIEHFQNFENLPPVSNTLNKTTDTDFPINESLERSVPTTDSEINLNSIENDISKENTLRNSQSKVELITNTTQSQDMNSFMISVESAQVESNSEKLKSDSAPPPAIESVEITPTDIITNKASTDIITNITSPDIITNITSPDIITNITSPDIITNIASDPEEDSNKASNEIVGNIVNLDELLPEDESNNNYKIIEVIKSSPSEYTDGSTEAQTIDLSQSFADSEYDGRLKTTDYECNISSCDELLQSTNYEHPVEISHLSYAIIDKSARFNSNNSLTNSITEVMPYLDDLYKELPLPKTPSIDKNHQESNYMSLINAPPSSSVTSMIGLKAYEKEISINTSSVSYDTNENYYASLTEVSKQDEDVHRELLLSPWYVVSIGVGHIDLRNARRTSTTLDLFKVFSSNDSEAQLFIWKLA